MSRRRRRKGHSASGARPSGTFCREGHMTAATHITHLARAEAELAAADAEVAKIEREVAPVLEKFAALHEQLNNLTETRGADCPDTRKVAAAIKAMSSQVAASQTKQERAYRHRTQVAKR